MLKSLLIKNFILIDELKLDFTSGFNVLCGETGAGKSIIIKALDAVMGAKISRDALLNKEKPFLIEATFLNKNEETVVSREMLSTSKYRLNGALISQDEIKELREKLLDIHSQHQTYSYMQSKSHIFLLDNYISKKNPEYKEVLKTYGENYSEFKKLEKKLEELRLTSEESEKEIEFLRFQLKELDDAQVKENEEEELKEETNILSNAQELKENTYSAYYALYGDNSSIVEALGKIKYNISSLSSLDKNLSDIESNLFDVFETLKDLANSLRDYSSSLEINPMRLDELNERISLIQKLKRKYGADLDLEREKLDSRLKELTSSDNSLENVENNYQIAKETIEFLAQRIEEYRLKEANELSILIEEKLKNLELKEANFKISVEKSNFNELGQNKVEFLISANKNQTLSPLIKVASGGEISRVMLSLKAIFQEVDEVGTVVFDEIDTGISGITSNAVKDEMLNLSSNTQIICITHQPIICAKADNFIWVSKKQNEKAEVEVKILNQDERLKALAQLASGEVNDKTIEFAKTLIK